MSSGGLQKRGVRVLAVIVIVAAGIFFAQKESAEEKEWWWRYAELEAQGEHLDLEAFVPPEIPDDQNFFKAPGIEEWFTLRSEVPRNVPAGVEVFHVPDWLRRKGMNLENLMRMRNARQESSASEPESFEDLILWKKRTEAGIAMLRQGIDAASREARRGLWDSVEARSGGLGERMERVWRFVAASANGDGRW